TETACFPSRGGARSGADSDHSRPGTEAGTAATRRVGLAGRAVDELAAIPNISVGLACDTADHIVTAGTALALDLA
ncbi:MAG: hypothetical protein WAL37_02305, partial [Xanthobacteraceae bacterium]